MAEAALAAFGLLGDEKYLAAFRRAYGWFHGQNSLHQPLVDVHCGSCYDGLQRVGRESEPGSGIDACLFVDGTEQQGQLNMRRESKGPDQFAELFRRHGDNPILTARDWPYPAHTVFNAGACQLGEETVLLVRVEDRRGHSHLTVARSNDGVSNWRIDSKPSFAARSGKLPGRRVGRGRRSPDLGGGPRPVDHRLHGLLAQRTIGVLGGDERLRHLLPARPGHASRGQGCGRLSPPLRQSVRDDSSAGFHGKLRRPHLAFLLARPDSLGRPPRPHARAARRVVGRQQDRPGPASPGNSRGLADPLPRRASDCRRVFVSTGTGLVGLGGSLSGSSAQRRMGFRTRDALRAPG